jgi:hypothetical protein
MRYILIAIQHLLLLAFGVVGVFAMLIAVTLFISDGFTLFRVLMIPIGIIFLAVAFWINDLDIG